MKNKSTSELRKTIKSLPEEISLEFFHQLIDDVMKLRYVHNQTELLLLLIEVTLEIDDKMKDALFKVGGIELLKRMEKYVEKCNVTL